MSASVTEKLLQRIDDNRDQAISFLRQMIAIPSVTGDEAKIQKFLAAYMGKIGLDVDIWLKPMPDRTLSGDERETLKAISVLKAGKVEARTAE